MKKSLNILLLFVFLIGSCQDTTKVMQDSTKIMTNNVEIMRTDEEWKEILTPEQYRVTRLKGTERPFTGIYDNFYEKGEYVCVCCGKTLFGSETKFKSGCGWPSFYDIYSNESLKFQKDNSHNMIRTEVLCANCDAHLGHVFNDGPPPTGLRYCINSVSLKFIPDKELDKK